MILNPNPNSNLLLNVTKTLSLCPPRSEPVLNLLYPPYNDQALQIVTGVVQQPIPS